MKLVPFPKKEPSDTKLCSNCDKVFPRTKEYFRISANNCASGRCKDCLKLYAQQYNKLCRKRRREHYAAYTSSNSDKWQRNEHGLTYLISDGTAYKIGSTRKAISARLRQLQVGNPRRLQLIATVKGANLEELLHEEFEAFRLHQLLGDCAGREWFELRPEIAEKFSKLNVKNVLTE